MKSRILTGDSGAALSDEGLSENGKRRFREKEGAETPGATSNSDSLSLSNIDRGSDPAEYGYDGGKLKGETAAEEGELVK